MLKTTMHFSLTLVLASVLLTGCTHQSFTQKNATPADPLESAPPTSPSPGYVVPQAWSDEAVPASQMLDELDQMLLQLEGNLDKLDVEEEF